ncbi:hypothetical protein N7465_009133 [Penicillium sp. CMV-2018d]|nr:hypothetical protein N7465_009133 [Penicillium sp. CMV-2018d]
MDRDTLDSFFLFFLMIWKCVYCCTYGKAPYATMGTTIYNNIWPADKAVLAVENENCEQIF